MVFLGLLRCGAGHHDVRAGAAFAHVRHDGQAPWLLVVGGALGALGSIVGGMQAGPYPPMQVATGVTVIRLLWVSGITLGVVASGLYLWGIKERKQ